MNAALTHAAINLMQDPKNPEEQRSTKREAAHTPVATTPNDTPATANNNNQDAPATANSTQHTPTAAAHAWHHTAMSAATFTLSALLAYTATEAIFKRIRGRNNQPHTRRGNAIH